METGAEIREQPPKSTFQLQTPREFRDDFVARAKKAQDRVGLETMQYELCDDTRPIFDSLLNSRASNVRFHADRVAGRHLAVGNSRATVLKGVVFPYRGGEWRALQKASSEREALAQALKEKGIGFEGGNTGHFRHNHVKLAVVDDVAWFGTMNLRKLDFDLSNFMMKVEDTYWVGVLKGIFDQTEQPDQGKDQIFKNEKSNDTELLFDAGIPKQSVIFERAHEMIGSMKTGDEFVYVGQWPPLKLMMGTLLDEIHTKVTEGITGTFLMSPESEMHPIERVSRFLQRKVDNQYTSNPHITTDNLPHGTHAKILLIKRADGSREALFGSHNLTSWTVRNGTRELSMWTKNPEITTQIEGFIGSLSER